jgi:hypothetical protein
VVLETFENAMMPWLETTGVLMLALVGVLVGRQCAQLRKPWWLASYLIPLILIILIGASRRFPRLELCPPCSWLMAGRTEFAMTGLLGTMILSTLLPHLKKARDKNAVAFMMVLVVVLAALPPFAAPLLHQTALASLRTFIDSDGVCRQTTDYSCGPAAAVTALRRLGLPAEEGEIARLACTSRLTGTEADVLAGALRKRYQKDGLTAQYRHFQSVTELAGPFLTIARIKFGILLDHYITVLQVTDREIIVADPLQGLVHMPHEEFIEIWRYCGVVVSRPTRSTDPSQASRADQPGQTNDRGG